MAERAGEPTQVWLASRHEPDSVLILGVFATDEVACTYCDRHECYGGLAWQPPCPGRRYWRAIERDREFRVEAWPIMSTADLVRHPAMTVRDDPPDVEGLGEVVAYVHRATGSGELQITLIRQPTGLYILRYRPGLNGQAEQCYTLSANDAYRYYADLEWLVSPPQAFPDGIPDAEQPRLRVVDTMPARSAASNEVIG